MTTTALIYRMVIACMAERRGELYEHASRSVILRNGGGDNSAKRKRHDTKGPPNHDL